MAKGAEHGEVRKQTNGGARLRPEILSVTIAAGDFGSKSIAEVCELSISDCADFLNSLTLGSREEAIAGQVLKEVQAIIFGPMSLE